MSTEFKKGDKVRVADNAAWANGHVTTGVMSTRGTVQVFDYLDPDGDAVLQNLVAVAPQYLTLFDDAGVEKAEDVAVTITREQRGAWIRVEESIQNNAAPDMEDLNLILPLLPEDLTNGPVLPEEPGFYLDAENSVWQLLEGGILFRVEDGETDARMFAPFIKLSVRTEITADQIRHIVGPGTLGRSEMDQLVALANGRKL